ncbi:YihY/virulence factor BrkB family protein [Nocardioides sp. CFH 31398]|uniref:YihY/virulence factor BrkB family protein n=1 Tax=Nocardioides sp. CFH 31398 TaxID=2919579 RepID=UPI001F062911|nr:YihY/virulence factor BrkB family protein [Nocardioides sp. CFH 31398]MCH1865749.1 YihY/virulence factor BrkB family protein [Nocardioides sp. CFH 31398]
MTTARLVPVTVEMDGEELDAEDAWHLVRRHGLKAIAVQSFRRFRYGDGFTNSRALALQTALAVVPFLLAVAGIAADVDDDAWSRVIGTTVNAVAPGGGSDDALARAAEGSEESGEVALVLGLGLAALTMMTAMAQVERGSNRIYGIRRDRPALWKYGRAAVFTAVLAAPVGLGLALLVAGGAFADAMTEEYGWSDGARVAFEVARWPLGLVLLVVTIATLFNHAPRRRQPALSWLALGSGVAVVLGATAAAALALYVRLSGSFDTTYGPLAGIIALLVWSQLSAMGLFYGIAVCAQLEAIRAHDPDPALDDPGRPHHQSVSKRV